MQNILKPLALVSKIIAAITWLGSVWFKIIELYGPRDRDLARASLLSLYVEVCVLLVVALLAVVPNRWLVSSPQVFITSLVVALVPLCSEIYYWVKDITPVGAFLHPILMAFFSLAIMVFVMVIFYVPLPLSLILSFWRGRKGQQVTYA